MGIKEYITGFGLGLALCIGASNYLHRDAAEKKIECLEKKVHTTAKLSMSRDEDMLEMMETARKAFENSYELGKLKHSSLQKQVQQLTEIINKYNIAECREYIRQIRENAKEGMEALERGRKALAAGGGPVPGGPDPLRIPRDPKKDTAYEHMSESYASLRKNLQDIEKNIESARAALEAGKEVLESRSSGSLDIPDIPVIPQNSPEYKKISESLDRSREYLRQMEENVRKGREAVQEATDLLKTGSNIVPHVPPMPVIPQEPSKKKTESGGK